MYFQRNQLGLSIRWSLVLCLFTGLTFLLVKQTHAQSQVSNEQVPNQFITIGPASEIDSSNLMGATQQGLQGLNSNVSVNQLARVSLNWISPNLWACTGQAAPSDLVMDLYQIEDSSQSSTDWSTQALSIMANLALNNVFTSYNYTTGDPLEIFPSSATNPFWSQWAFSTANGIDLSTGTARSGDFLYTGSGVTVGIFDTSPYDTEGLHQFPTAPLNNMQVEVFLPTLYSSYQPTQTNAADHGLFIAGLVYAVAPDANIQLHRILHEDAQGNLFDLAGALSNFIQNASGPTVINLSLGIDVPSETSSSSTCQNDDAVLKTLLSTAYDRDIVTVAAAGNDSLSTPQGPAVLAEVVGVAASNPGKILANYSNQVPDSSNNLTAPGGEGTCDSQPNDCIIGPALGSNTGYTYWEGTSFSTPMIAGAAALFMQRSVQQGAAPDSAQIVSNVIQTVASGTNGQGRGAGILDLSCNSIGGSLLRACSNTPANLTIPTSIPATAGQNVSVPIQLTNSISEEIASLTFSVDFDQTCLSFDSTDSNGDDLPDAIPD